MKSTNFDNILDMEKERVKAEESEMETGLVGDWKAEGRGSTMRF